MTTFALWGAIPRWRDFVFPTALSYDEIERIARSVVYRLGLRREPVEDYIQIVCVHLCRRGDEVDRADNPDAQVRVIAKNRLLDYERVWTRHYARDVPVVYAEDTPDISGDPGRFVPERLDLSHFLQTAGPAVCQVVARRLNFSKVNDGRGLSSRRSAAERKADSRVLLKAQAHYGHLLAA